MSLFAWLRWLVWDDERRRVRVLVRLALHTVAVLLAYLAGGAIGWLTGGAGWGRAVAIVVQTAAVVSVTWALARFVDRRSPLELTGQLDARAALDLGVGMLLGGVLIAAVGGAEVSMGLAHYSVTGAAVNAGELPLARVSTVILFFVSIAIDEELWFRGYQLTNVADSLTGRLGVRRARLVALVITSVLFGLAHALNPNATLLSTTNVAIGGVLLGVSFAITGRLGLSIGLHLTWNTAQCLLDMPVSGQVIADDLLVRRDELGADVITGGAFGPEGGLLGLGAIVVGTAVCVLYASLAGQPAKDD